jgi:hypothetical protein
LDAGVRRPIGDCDGGALRPIIRSRTTTHRMPS